MTPLYSLHWTACVTTLICGGWAWSSEFSEPNRVLRDGAIRYGDANFDPQTNLVRRVDAHHNRLDVCQHSLEYAAALFNAGRRADRANAVLAAVLDHQDVDQRSATFGNFLWWHGETRVRDRNAVCFMSPWLSHIALEYGGQLTAENAQRLPAGAAAVHSGCPLAWQRARLYQYLVAEGRVAGNARPGTE